MIRTALTVENLGKCYTRFDSEWMRFARWFGIPTKAAQEKWVIRNISFRVDHGEAVAIIGQNGAGKSTLLKMITGTTRPNEGRISIDGRVSALLELGLGFNPELSGRENVLHVAGMRGISYEQAQALVPQIEAFAEIGEYFDQPVRTYSSGMQMRVAFSVATAVRPDILIVDEALSVGDSYFVHKSFQRIKEFREAGTTLLFVSHDPGAVRILCDRAILLDSGKLVMEGNPSEVLDYYNALVAEREGVSVKVDRTSEGKAITESGSGEAHIIDIALLDDSGAPIEIARVGQSVRLRLRARSQQAINSLVFGYMIRDRLGQSIFGTNTHHTDQVLKNISSNELLEFEAAFPLQLGPGSYSVSIALHADETHISKNYLWRDLALVFNVVNLEQPMFVGCAWIPSQIKVTRLSAKELSAVG